MAADLVANPVNFQLVNSGSFPQSLVLTDANAPSGRSPRALLMLLSGHRAATALNVPHVDGRLTVGFCDLDTLAQMACGTVFEGGAAPANANASWRTDKASVFQLNSQTGPGLEVEATVTSRGAGTVTMLVSSATQFYGTCLFLYADEGVSIVAAVEQFVSATNVAATFTSTALGSGRAADLVVAASVNAAFPATPSDPPNSGDQGMISFGIWARSSNTQGCVTSAMEDRKATNTSVGGILRNDAVLCQVTSAAGTVLEGTRVALSTSASGFTGTTRHPTIVAGLPAPTLEGIYISLFLSGARCWVGTPTLDLSTIATLAPITGAGLAPIAAIAACFRTAAVNTVANTQNALGIGFANALAQGGCALFSRDAQPTSDANSITSHTRFLNSGQASLVVDWAGHLVSLDADGITPAVDDAATGSRPILLALIGAALGPRTPTAVALPLVIPAPSRRVTEVPSPAVLALALPAPARLLTETPTARTIPLVLPAPTRLVSEVPAAVALPLLIAAPARLLTEVPAPVALALVLPAPAVLAPETPAAVALALVLPAPAILTAEAPAAVALPLIVATPARLVTEVPAAVALPLLVATPSRLVAEVPSPVALALVVAAPARLLTELPAPVALPLVLEEPTVLFAEKESPGAVHLALVLPAPAILVELTPASVALALALPAPSVTRTETPAAVTLPLLVATPSRLVAEVPAPVVLALVVAAPARALTALPSPVALVLALPAPAVLVVLAPDSVLLAILVGALVTESPIGLELVVEITRSLELEADLGRTLDLVAETARGLDLVAALE